MTDTPCERAGTHLSGTGHSQTDCPTLDGPLITSPEQTTPERLRYLRDTNWRLRRFLSRATAFHWTIETSGVAKDCIIVRRPRSEDHFVLYPRGAAGASALTVYDGRDGYEFSPIPIRDAARFISQNGA